MKENVREQREVPLRRAAATLVAIAAVATGTVHASPPNPGEGARLATFDVTEPLRIKGWASVHLDVSGPFDVVSPVGNQAELVRFRQRQEDAVLDLPRIGAPPAQDFGPIDTVLSYELNRLFDVKQVRAQMTRTDMGSTCMLTENGLCPIWRPAVGWIHQLTEISPD
jgi:hypothetical protein